MGTLDPLSVIGGSENFFMDISKTEREDKSTILMWLALGEKGSSFYDLLWEREATVSIACLNE